MKDRVTLCSLSIVAVCFQFRVVFVFDVCFLLTADSRWILIPT